MPYWIVVDLLCQMRGPLLLINLSQSRNEEPLDEESFASLPFSMCTNFNKRLIWCTKMRFERRLNHKHLLYIILFYIF